MRAVPSLPTNLVELLRLVWCSGLRRLIPISMMVSLTSCGRRLVIFWEDFRRVHHQAICRVDVFSSAISWCYKSVKTFEKVASFLLLWMSVGIRIMAKAKRGRDSSVWMPSRFSYCPIRKSALVDRLEKKIHVCIRKNLLLRLYGVILLFCLEDVWKSLLHYVCDAISSVSY